MTQKRANILYILIQILFFMSLAGICCFATPYLTANGFSSGQIGLILGIANLVTVAAQQIITTVIRKTSLLLGNFLTALFTVMILLCLALILLKPQGVLLPILFGAVIVCGSAAQPSINALYRGYHNQGTSINFAVARGCGSAAFSLSSYAIGQLVRTFTESVIPAAMAVPLLFVILALIRFHAPNVEMKGGPGREERISLLRDYPHFILFLVGVTLIASTHSFVETFLLVIVRRMGGDSGTVGTAMALSAITELPAMLLYKPFSKKVGNRRLMVIAAWIWSSKCALILFSRSLTLVYLAELLQFGSYALYVPTASKHIAHVIPESMYLRGEALAGSAITGGALIATLIGGQLLDRLGMPTAFYIMQGISVCGAICLTIAIAQSLKRIPHVKKA